MVEQILAIAPILPGQKVNHGYDIPPRTPNTTTHNEHNQPQDQKVYIPPSSGGNDLIDFGGSASNVKAVATNQIIPLQQHRMRSVSLMDDDHHINAMNDKMGNMRLMEPMTSPAKPSNRREQPLQRTDTQTSEVDAFFDAAEG